MPFKSSDTSDDANFASEAKPSATAKVAGTVLKYFHGPTRRFPVDYLIVDSDSPDLPMPMDVLKSRGFIA
jgi:hypothetical protein